MVVEKYGTSDMNDANQAFVELLSLLIESAQVISGELLVKDLGNIIVNEARRIFGANAVWLLIYDPADGLLKMDHYWGPGKEMFGGFSVKPGVGIPGKVFTEQNPKIILKAYSQLVSVSSKKVSDEEMPVLAAFPLTVGDRRIGVFGISSEKIGRVGLLEPEIDFLVSAFANHIAIAIDTANLFEEKKEIELELKNSVRNLQMLNEIGTYLIKDLSLSTVMQKVALYIAEITGSDAAVICIENEGGTPLEPVYSYNISPAINEILMRAKKFGPLAHLENSDGVIINDCSNQPWAFRELIDTGVVGIALVPAMLRGKMLATISVVNFSKERKYTEEDLEKLQLISRQLAIAIENASLYQEQVEVRTRMESYANQLKMLNDFAQSINKETVTRKMADKLADAARALLDCSYASVLLYSEAGDSFLAFSWLDGESKHSKVIDFNLSLNTHDSLYGEIYRTKKPIRLTNTYGHPAGLGIPQGQFPARGLLGAPLICSKGDFLGQIMVTDKRDGSDFTKTDEELLVALCSQVAIGIEKALLYEQEHNVAEFLQQAILAIPKELPGVEVGITYESAAEVAKVGGDFYDLFDLGGGRIGILIGDVSGKGLEAATITSMVKSTIRAFAYKGHSPALVLSEANKVISWQLDPNQFVTMVYGVLDIGTGKLTFSRAGHPELIVWHKEGCSYHKVESNLPIGIFDEVIYDENEVELSAGDGIILYTDGLIETRFKDQLLGDDILIKELNQITPGKTPQEVAFELVNMVKKYTSGKPQDDMAVVIFKVKPEQ